MRCTVAFMARPTIPAFCITLIPRQVLGVDTSFSCASRAVAGLKLKRAAENSLCIQLVVQMCATQL